MGTFLLLIAEATAVTGELAEGAEHSGIGLNTNIFETNLINLAIIITVLFVFGRKVLGNTLKTRRENIETAIKSAEERAANAAKQLKVAEEKLTQAQVEANRIKADAETNAKAAGEAILVQAAADVEKMQAAGAADLNAELERVISQLRQKVVAQALQKAEAELKAGIAEDAQIRIIDRSIAQLGG
ncbi:F0F1 ATP synthase subunit B [Cylindrospermopsis raciborskii S07]|jgi:F-type H+-transporting ATPase subunit b|uniref:ATP synthase subunit b n=3 Tax=Cylindrospermopsis raciborskii TaxID=77022 RepID=A0A853M790_9CYAN|nr:MULTISPECIES: F0F1 ATP synthase subunit B [Cylindrospermopsis]MBU6345548.1 F0F1 ATP synthase subunit B [Cyanobacteria bacterium REEB494]EFA69143.1 ATP synthase subunit b [Cylindrospermopsis raciborskii CS-505]KRH97863.1 ATP synthase F0F1 subunit B [Cylindrospermopsis sp. CR12]MBA4444608.1 F0F1 ATP synthase subunit B [Cylindrospermopsis raciborskii CS-506_C]MBA4448825.1 F0F1 ATP synthase subunit B [Cylindrospermopsis raciborskii CS-506_D]